MRVSRPTWMIGGAVLLLLVAGIVTAGVVRDDADARTTDRCADADSPERCAHHARMRAYCADHPRDERCQDHARHHAPDQHRGTRTA